MVCLSQSYFSLNTLPSVTGFTFTGYSWFQYKCLALLICCMFIADPLKHYEIKSAHCLHSVSRVLILTLNRDYFPEQH
jgi:hypothetical protein